MNDQAEAVELPAQVSGVLTASPADVMDGDEVTLHWTIAGAVYTAFIQCLPDRMPVTRVNAEMNIYGVSGDMPVKVKKGETFRLRLDPADGSESIHSPFVELFIR